MKVAPLGSLNRKLLAVMLPLCLIPLIGISFFSYFQAKERITEDRSVLYLEQLSQAVADTIQLTVLEKREETETIGLFFTDFLEAPSGSEANLVRENAALKRLNNLVRIHEVYDLLIIFDIRGRILLTNSINRNRVEQTLDANRLALLRGTDLTRYTPDASWLQQVRSGRVGYIDWHFSGIVSQLYDYSGEDIARRYSIGFAAPIPDERGVVIGGVLALMNWENIQEILDLVEAELESRQLTSGYAFLFGSDHDTIIGHKYRRNRRSLGEPEGPQPLISNNYGTSLKQDHKLFGLAAEVEGMSAHASGLTTTHFIYEYPPGTTKISGLASVDHEFFAWVCGVGINDVDIFAPVQDLKNVLIGAALFSSVLITLLTVSVARQIATPLKRLTEGAARIAGGDLANRVEVSGRDEIGQLASQFNEMAASLQDRSQALLDLNRQLEEKVIARTRALQESHEETEAAYRELKEAQVQLVQSEKMASLGQLVAGIAHEIKNPLNFIYGNTDFLRRYVEQLRQLISLYQELPLQETTQQKVAQFKNQSNYDFVQRDLNTLIDNFEEGAKRIHAIIGDLRAFSRMDTDQMRSVDIHEPIELALNLIRHEYRDRVRIHKQYGEVPKVECNAGKLSQVFMNLLANACQAIPDEGDIWIRSRSENGQVVVEIEDNGSGIEEPIINKIFEPFFTTKPVGDGTGLGLSISYGIIQQHRGQINVDSTVGQGTEFRITLPVNNE